MTTSTLFFGDQLAGVLDRRGGIGSIVENDVVDLLTGDGRGNRATVFFSGIPSEAAGPVAESVTPTLISAWTPCGKGGRHKNKEPTDRYY
jgi:hypothetical protein